MRLGWLIGGVAASGLTLAAVACGGTDSTGTPGVEDDDGGSSGRSSSSGASSSSNGGPSSSSSSSSSSSGGSGTVTITPKELKSGGAVLVGVTEDDRAVYVTIGGASSALEAVPLTGGTPDVIAATFDPQTEAVVVSGGAVAWWTGLDADGIGTINVWSKAAGAKTALADDSAAGVFAASSDGSRVAYSVATNAQATQTDLWVTDTSAAAPVANGIFVVADSINLAALGGANPSCGLDLAFVGKKLFAAFCTGTSASATAARLYYVPADSTTEVRLDDKGGAAGDINPFWLSDKTGSKLFVIGTGANATGRIIDPVGLTSVALENDTAFTGFLTDDGSAVVYRTATGGLRRASTGATPAPKTLIAGAKTLLDTSSDKSHVLVRTLDPVDGLIDIRTGDTTTENQTPKDIVATATASPLGFSGSGAVAVYLADVTDMGNSLKSRGVTGGPERVLGKDVEGVAIAPEGDGVIVFSNGQAQGQLTLFEASYVNAVSGATSAKIADGIPDSGFALVKKKLVYTRVAQTGAGLFVAPLP